MTFKKKMVAVTIAITGTAALAFGGYAIADKTVFHANNQISSAQQTPAPQSLTVDNTTYTASITNANPKDYKLDYHDNQKAQHATFEKQTFDSEQAATDALNYFGKQDGTKNKLKDGTAATSQGTLGQVYTHWNQDGWSITTVTASEAAGGQKPAPFANQIASQLNQFSLPKHDVNHGALVLYSSKESGLVNTISWQSGTHVYQVNSDNADLAIQLSHQAN